MKSPRSAKTLIEVSIVVAISSVALMLSATTLVALFRLERQARSASAHQSALARLSSRWRADVHAATDAQVDQAAELTLAGGRTIRYVVIQEATRAEVTREVREQGAVVHRDAFVLEPQSRVTISTTGEPASKLLTLAVEPRAKPTRRHQLVVRPATIVAALHLHRAASQQATQDGGPP